MQFTNARSDRHIFIPRDSGSPKNGLFAHVSGLGPIARLDFERYNVAGEVIFKVEGDAFTRPFGRMASALVKPAPAPFC